MPAKKKKVQIATYTHPSDTRRNIPTAEVEPTMDKDKRKPITLEYERSSRNTDLDPQLVWRGKDEQDQTDFIVTAPPIFIQEKVHPKVLIANLLRQSSKEKDLEEEQLDLFSDFNGLEDQDLKSDYYEHEQNWANRMILGDSLQVMASLASREGLQGQVQCIYIDPPYGIRFNSNFQWSTNSRDVKDGNAAHISREPEQVKAFRDTWRDGIHSYLTYLRDRLTVARDLLADSGSIFVQIGDENVHRVRSLMDEVFGEENACSIIPFVTTSSQTSELLPSTFDFLLWYAKDRRAAKFRRLYKFKAPGEEGGKKYTSVELPSGERGSARSLVGNNLPTGARLFRPSPLVSQSGGANSRFPVEFQGKTRYPRSGFWKTNQIGIDRLSRSNRLVGEGVSVAYIRYLEDFPVFPISAFWDDTWGVQSRSDPKRFVVQTSTQVIERCILMTTDPGDLVLDPTCGSGTTAYVAEQWGRRWIAIDTSRVALALARTRIMGARFAYYLMADSPEGQSKEADISRRVRSEAPTYSNIRHGFVYERVPHITLRDIANNAEIDVIYEDYQEKLEPISSELNQELKTAWEEWEIPQEVNESWTDDVKNLHQQWWEIHIARQKEIDASIAARADSEYLYDKPYEDKNKVRVAGPFTVESLSPHRLLVSGDPDEPIATSADTLSKNGHQYEGTAPERDFASMIIENLRTSGVQQPNKDDKIEFNSIEGWPGEYICAEAEYTEGESEKRAGIFIGPEFGTVGPT